MTKDFLQQIINILAFLIGFGVFILASSLRFRRAKQNLTLQIHSSWVKAYLIFTLLINALFISGITALIFYFFMVLFLK